MALLLHGKDSHVLLGRDLVQPGVQPPWSQEGEPAVVGVRWTVYNMISGQGWEAALWRRPYGVLWLLSWSHWRNHEV